MATSLVTKKATFPAKTTETKEQKLLKLAGKRIPKTLKSIQLIGNLAAYKPTESDVDQIMSALGEACAAVEARLRGSQKAPIAFSLRTVSTSK